MVQRRGLQHGMPPGVPVGHGRQNVQQLLKRGWRTTEPHPSGSQPVHVAGAEDHVSDKVTPKGLASDARVPSQQGKERRSVEPVEGPEIGYEQVAVHLNGTLTRPRRTRRLGPRRLYSLIRRSRVARACRAAVRPFKLPLQRCRVAAACQGRPSSTNPPRSCPHGCGGLRYP